MADIPILTDKSPKINQENKINNLDTKNINEISPSSPAYIFCKSLNEINNKSENGWTPIYKSIMANNKLGLECLLKLGADPNLTNNLGETPLYLCVESENYEFFKILIEYGADTNIQKRNGDTPLHLIIKKKLENKYIIEIFKGKANPNIKNKLYEQTPTHLCLINKSNEDILINFWKNNADIYTIKDKYDKTPFDYAKELNDEKYTENIIKIFGTKDTPKKYNIQEEHEKDKEENTVINNIENDKKILEEPKIEKKLDFDKQTLSSKRKEKEKEIISISEKEGNESRIKQNTGSNNNIKALDIDKISSIASISKYDNEDLNSGINEKIIDLEKEPSENNKYNINKKLNEYTKERGTVFSNSNSNTEKGKTDSNKNNISTHKENDFSISHLTYNNEKYIGNKEIILDKRNKKIFSAEKQLNREKDKFNKTETRILENDLEKISYKIFKNIKILNKKKKEQIKKPKKSNNNDNKYGYINNENNFYYESKNIDDTEKDISTINNENSFFYEGEETINESDIHNNISNKDKNKENIDPNNLVYHNKNHLATKEKNKKRKEITYKTSTNPLYQKNKFFSPDCKFSYKCFNRNSFIQNEQNIFLNNMENINTSNINNSYVYNQYRNNNIIINKNKSSFNKHFYEINSLNNTTFSSVRNNSRNNIKPMINRNSITSNSFTNNSFNNNSFKNNNTSFIINDYYNNKYQINSYKINQNNKLIKFRDWLISCDLLCYYNTLVKNHMYNIDKYIENIRKNKINVINFKDIEEFGIKKPGHIFRLLIKLQIDAGKIDYNIYKFILDKFNANTMTNNGAMTTSYNEVNCFGLNCCLSNNNYNYSNIKKTNSNMNDNEIMYYDIFSFLKMNNLLKFKENFIHNGFDQIDYILIQLFSRYSFNKKILNDYMHIYLEEDKNYILKILYKEKKKICSLVGIQYNDDEIKKILYNDYIRTLSESYTSNYQNNHDDCCFIF